VFNSNFKSLSRRFFVLAMLLGALVFFTRTPVAHADPECDATCLSDYGDCRDYCELRWGRWATVQDPDQLTMCRMECFDTYNGCEYTCSVGDGTPCYICDNNLTTCHNGCETNYNNCYDACAPGDTTCQNNCATERDNCNNECQVSWYDCQYGCIY
jgi:hypothetical protein